MCYGTTDNYERQQLEIQFHFRSKYAFDNEDWRQDYNISGFAHPNLRVISIENPQEITLMKWGLLPNWIKDEVEAIKYSDNTLNARAETIFEKRMFKNIIMGKRCILPVPGFYEWREFNKKKYPYFIYTKNSELLPLGCIYDSWVNETTGELINSFSIVTTEANDIMAMIHNTKKRMPLILDEKGWMQWIQPKTTKEEIRSLLKPAPNEILSYHTISKDISNRRIDTNYPEIQSEVIYPALVTLF